MLFQGVNFDRGSRILGLDDRLGRGDRGEVMLDRRLAAASEHERSDVQPAGRRGCPQVDGEKIEAFHRERWSPVDLAAATRLERSLARGVEPATTATFRFGIQRCRATHRRKETLAEATHQFGELNRIETEPC